MRSALLVGTRLVIAAAFTAIAAAYVWRLDAVPAAMSGDEVMFGNHALALARSAHDLNGRLLPLFIQISEPLTPDLTSAYWYQPFLFYVIAATLTVLPFSEWSVRLPVALLGLLNIALTGAVAARLFRDRRYGLLAAAMLGLTPAHVIMSRQALDYLCPATFALLWLWCLQRYLDGLRTRVMLMGVILGIGTFSYVASWALMPALFAITAAVMWHRGQARDVRPLAAGFALPVIVVAAWLVLTPDLLEQTLSRYGRSYQQSRLSLYWDYFDPSFLFIAGGTDPTQTTSGAGVFLLPLAVLLPVGIVTALARRTAIDLILVAGFLLAPLPIAIALPGSPDYSAARAMLLVPFGVLLAMTGLKRMVDRRGWTLVAAVMLVVLLPVQFIGFARDYFGDYAERSATRFDAGSNRAFAARLLELVDREPTPAIYLDGYTAGRAQQWIFYVNARGRPDVWTRTRYYDPAGGELVSPGSLLVVESAAGPVISRRSTDGAWINP